MRTQKQLLSAIQNISITGKGMDDAVQSVGLEDIQHVEANGEVSLANKLLKARGVVEIEEVRIDLDPVRRDEMMEKTRRRTVPQIYIGDTHVGGCDELIALDAAGELKPLLAAGA